MRNKFFLGCAFEVAVEIYWRNLETDCGRGEHSNVCLSNAFAFDFC